MTHKNPSKVGIKSHRTVHLQSHVPNGYFNKNWTNNNSESLNRVLKQAIDWQSKPLLDLHSSVSLCFIFSLKCRIQ
jgi:hypothetical protein